MSGPDRAEVLRYLGHRGQQLEPGLMAMLDRAMAMCEHLARPRFSWGAFDDPTVALPGAERTALFAATIGHEIGREIDAWQRRDMAMAAMLDAAATEAVERAADEAEARIAEWARGQGLFPCPRVSPGYGALPLALHRPILSLLDAGRKLGLMATDSLILTPAKSVTALVGLHDRPVHAEGGCGACARRADCQYSRMGD